jgi:hypothetical protein
LSQNLQDGQERTEILCGAERNDSGAVPSPFPGEPDGAGSAEQ